ncbi:MAG: PaaI family thioesterase [Pseudomonadota bacterium]
MDAVMSIEALEAFLAETFPQVADTFAVEEITEAGIRMRLVVGEQHLRPGGTVSGPSMFGLADVSVYLAILSRIGPQALAVTTNCSIDFMRKPAAATDIVAECTLLKLGRVLAVGDALLYSVGLSSPVARATLTYSIPPKPAG